MGENCKYVRMGFHGSLEVYSGLAFSKLLSHMEDCQTRLPIHSGDHAHFREYGEDKFAAWCMHLVGVDKIPSRQQVDSLPEDTMIQGLHITVSCPGHRTKFERTMKKWHPNCTKTKYAILCRSLLSFSSQNVYSFMHVSVGSFHQSTHRTKMSAFEHALQAIFGSWVCAVGGIGLTTRSR